MTNNVSWVSVWISPYSPERMLKVVYPFLTGDQILLNTTIGQRSITRVRSSVANVDLLAYVSDDSKWFELSPGGNLLMVDTNLGANNKIWGDFTYIPQFWGV
jgi:hypothetical protein